MFRTSSFRSYLLLFCIASFLLFCIQPATAAEKKSPVPTEKKSSTHDQQNASKPAATAPQNGTSLEQTLKAILEGINATAAQISTTEKLLKAAPDTQKARVKEDLTDLYERMDDLIDNFARTASGFDVSEITSDDKEDINLESEIRELLAPIIIELKGITNRPRRIEQLNRKLNKAKQVQEKVQQAMARIKNVLDQVDDGALKARLQTLAQDWLQRGQQLQSEIAYLQLSLEEELKNNPSIVSTLTRLTESFFKKRGRNILLSAGAFLFVILLMRFVGRQVERRLKSEKIVRSMTSRRLIALTYGICTYSLAVVSMLLVLYSAGDWVLLGIVLLLLLGLGWSARVSLPLYIEQAKLLLNLGTVRKGERIVIDGIPWKVMTIGYYSILANPNLSGGVLRLRLKDLVDKSSRPATASEPWFPCRQGDWILLADETFGQVDMQTPELVRLKLFGDTPKTYITTDFLSQCPQNLSDGFAVRLTFGLDYKYQKIITTEIPAMVEHAIREALETAGYALQVQSLSVSFMEAAASSLDLICIGCFTGDAAANFKFLKMIFAQACVEAANTHGWEIPFTQLTLHQAKA